MQTIPPFTFHCIFTQRLIRRHTIYISGNIEFFSQELLRFERTKHCSTRSQDVCLVLTLLLLGAITVDTLNHAFFDFFFCNRSQSRHCRLQMIFVIQRDVIKTVFRLIGVHALNAIFNNDRHFKSKSRVIASAVRNSQRKNK